MGGNGYYYYFFRFVVPFSPLSPSPYMDSDFHMDYIYWHVFGNLLGSVFMYMFITTRHPVRCWVHKSPEEAALTTQHVGYFYCVTIICVWFSIPWSICCPYDVIHLFLPICNKNTTFFILRVYWSMEISDIRGSSFNALTLLSSCF